MIPIAVLFQNLLSSSLAIQSRIAAKRSPELQWPVTLWMFLILVIGGVSFALIRGDIDYSVVTNPKLMMLFFINGLLFGAGTGLLYYSYNKIDAAVIQIISSIRIPLVAILSILFLDQSLSAVAIMGMILVTASIVMVVKKPAHYKGWEAKALLISFIVPLMAVVGIITEKITLNTVNVSTFLAFSWPMELLWVYISSIAITRSLRVPTDRLTLRYAIPLGFTRLVGGFLFVWLLENVSNTSFVGAMSGISVVMTALFAALFLKETKHLRLKIIASLLCFIGVALVYI